MVALSRSNIINKMIRAEAALWIIYSGQRANSTPFGEENII